MLSHQVSPSWGSFYRAYTALQIHYEAFNQLNSGCSSQHLLSLHFPIVVADSTVQVFPELAKCASINSDKAVRKMPLMFLILQKEEQHTELTEKLTNTFHPKRKKGTIERLLKAQNWDWILDFFRPCGNPVTVIHGFGHIPDCINSRVLQQRTPELYCNKSYAAIWQEIHKYLLPYHQTTEQLHSSGCEPPELILNSPLSQTGVADVSMTKSFLWFLNFCS